MSSQLGHGLLPYLRRVAAGSDASPDAVLLNRFATEGDDGAFAVLVRRHGPMILGVCRRVLRDHHDAEDAFQATFLVLARRAGSLSSPDQLANWLYGVAYRTALEARTRRLRRQGKESQVVKAQADEASCEATWRDLRRVLDEEIQRLPTRYRSPFVLCVLEGKTNEEAAALLCCPLGTIFSRLSWARERLRQRLGGRGVGLSAMTWAALWTSDACSAVVPATLFQKTISGASVFARAPQAAAEVSAEVLHLAQGVLKTMNWTTVKVFAGSLFVVAALTLGALALSAGPAQQAAQAPAKQGQKGQEKAKYKDDANASSVPGKSSPAVVTARTCLRNFSASGAFTLPRTASFPSPWWKKPRPELTRLLARAKSTFS